MGTIKTKKPEKKKNNLKDPIYTRTISCDCCQTMEITFSMVPIHIKATWCRVIFEKKGQQHGVLATDFNANTWKTHSDAISYSGHL